MFLLVQAPTLHTVQVNCSLAGGTSSYFGAGFHMPLGVALLLAAIGGALLVGIVGGARIMQLRRSVRRRN